MAFCNSEAAPRGLTGCVGEADGLKLGVLGHRLQEEYFRTVAPDLRFEMLLTIAAQVVIC